MSSSFSNKSSNFFSEILRRRVLQTTGGYLVICVMILEGSDYVLPSSSADSYQSMLVTFLILMLPVVILLSWYFDLTSKGVIVTPSPSPELIHNQNAAQSANTKIKPQKFIKHKSQMGSVAILPFTNSSDDPDCEYISDGITESIINRLTRIGDIRVIPRNSSFRYKNSSLSLTEVCEELSVQNVVTGSVRHFEDQLIVQAELVDVSKNSQLWGDRFNIKWDEVFSLQDEIATDITIKLKPELSGEDKKLLEFRETEKLEAYKYYLQGNYLWNKRSRPDINRSIDFFNNAIKEDPFYSRAYTGLANVYNVLGYYNIESPANTFPLVKDSNRKALEVDPDSAEAYASLGFATLFFDRDWAAAKENFERSFNLDPNYAVAHHWYSWYLIAIGKYTEALASFERACAIDPVSLIINDHLAYGYMIVGNMKKARAQIERTQTLDQNYSLAYWRLGDWHLMQNEYEEAENAYLKVNILRQDYFALGYLGLTYGLMGRVEDAHTQLERLEELEKENYVSPLDFALIYAGLNDLDRMFNYLDTAIATNVSDMVRFELLPWPESVKSDHRFGAIVQKLKLP